MPDLYCGFDVEPKSGPIGFDLDRFWSKLDLPSLLHLHGSVHFGFPPGQGDIGELFWFNNLQEAASHAIFGGAAGADRRMDGTTNLRSAVVTGLQKLGNLQMRPLSHFYSSFALDIMSTDLIFVIGSGLTDLHLNTWLSEARSRSPRPPLLFVDFWKNGYERDTFFERDSKTISMFHGLHVMATDSIRPSRKDDWLITSDRTAAIWDKGFQAFLGAQGQLDGLISDLA